jgi:hypothetical protein
MPESNLLEIISADTFGLFDKASNFRQSSKLSQLV